MTAALKLPSVFSDHMVFQRDLPLKLWGWAAPQAKITAALAGQSGSAVADSSGKWTIALKPLSAGGPHELSVTAGTETVKRSDILVGDVWVCSGQSNMEWPLSSATDSSKHVAEASHPRIRLFNIPRVTALEPANDVDATWSVCSPETGKNFSAVGYFFGRQLQRDLNVPIGLIGTSWGGTPAEAWTPAEQLQSESSLAHLLEPVKSFKITEIPQPHADPGNKGEPMGWAKPQFDDANWTTMELPRTWHSTGLNIDGSVWFRRTVDLPADFAGKPVQLNVGVANDFDHTYFNGKLVGKIGKEREGWWTVPREYPVDAAIVKPGLNTIAVRVFNQWAAGGMMGPAAEMKIFPVGQPEKAIPLAGTWKYQVETALPHREANNHIVATVLYNAMIHPIVDFGIKGAIWYQGESNAGRAFQYRTLFPTMIKSWRSRWNQGDFPFLFVQLANYIAGSDSDAGSPWAELRDAQTSTLSLPNTGQAVILDIGEARDIHPRNKLDVGLRLAHEAMRIAYGKAAPRSPMLDTVKFENGQAIVTFKHSTEGLMVKGEHAECFTLAGEDRRFHPAKAKVEGSTVTLTSAAVTKPVAVRYAWAENPPVNVYNKAGLPACPFRTDDWPMCTVAAK